MWVLKTFLLETGTSPSFLSLEVIDSWDSSYINVPLHTLYFLYWSYVTISVYLNLSSTVWTILSVLSLINPQTSGVKYRWRIKKMLRNLRIFTKNESSSQNVFVPFPVLVKHPVSNGWGLLFSPSILGLLLIRVFEVPRFSFGQVHYTSGAFPPLSLPRLRPTTPPRTRPEVTTVTPYICSKISVSRWLIKTRSLY